jgi:hypothetical protein
MPRNWKPDELKAASIGSRTAKYDGIPANDYERQMRQKHPEKFTFDAISIGDKNGQAFMVPLDESSRETAEYILRAIAAYDGE